MSGRPNSWSDLPLALTVEQAAACLGISRNLCYQMVAQNRIASITLGRRIVIPRVAIEQLLNTAAEQPVMPATDSPVNR